VARCGGVPTRREVRFQNSTAADSAATTEASMIVRTTIAAL